MKNVSSESRMESFGEFVYGYVDGEYYNIKNTPEQISAFIVKHRLNNVKIISVMDVMLITTSFGFLDYVADQAYLQSKLLPVLVPMQRGEVEPIEYVPYQLVTDDSVLATRKQVELKGAKFDVVVTKEPHIIHLLELEGPQLVTGVIDSTWEDTLIKLLNLPDAEEGYQLYCYCHEENDVILEYGFDGDSGPMFTRVYEDEPVWPEFLENMSER